MPSNLSSEELRRLTALGAQARLEQIDMERRAIVTTFPELRTAATRQAAGRRRAAKRTATPAAAEPAKPARRVHRMSLAERRAVSERMKRYWAERRKVKAAQKK